MSHGRPDFRQLAGLLAFVMLPATIPHASFAQEDQHKPFISPSEMPHRTRMLRMAEANPTQNGRWDLLPFHMPIHPVHVALMNTGEVLIVSGSGNDPDNKII